MLYSEIIAVCSEIHTKHINTLCGQNVEFVNVKLLVHIVTTGLYRVKLESDVSHALIYCVVESNCTLATEIVRLWNSRLAFVLCSFSKSREGWRGGEGVSLIWAFRLY
jgi:hypothetical protein